MTNYVKSTNFASKDSLASGNPLKIIKGTEFDTEFNNIATAIDTKADLNSPVFIGTPVAPTAGAGTNTTQLATTAFVQAALQAMYPVGSIYTNAGVTTNPGTLLGFGTWVAFGAGRVMIGLNGSDALFDTLEETGGSKDATLVSHTHTATTSVTNPTHTHTYSGTTGTTSVTNGSYAPGFETSAASAPSTLTTSATAQNTTATTSLSTNGSSATNANLQPYITVAMWKRTA
jgi:hypothetical protein